jgi:ABC-type glutathione transport system ATPase component
MTILEVKNLTAGYGTHPPVIHDLSFELQAGQTVGICGPSGCGKTTVIWAVLGMLQKMGGYVRGKVFYDDENLLEFTENRWKTLRWSEFSLVPQSSMNTFNPVFTIARTFTEMLRAHKVRDTEGKVESLLDSVGLPPSTLKRYPHELSGGMRQRVSIALALLLDPKVLILDEATTGLDVIIEADILRLIRSMQDQRGVSIMFISHDRRISGQFCDRSITL